MKKILLLFLLTGFIYASEFDSLFNDIEIQEASSLSFKGESEFSISIPYKEIDSFTTPEMKNFFYINYNSDVVEVVSEIRLDLWEKSFELSPGDNYLKLNFSNSSIKVGYITYNWGFADKINPVNQLNTKDFTDPLNTINIPSLSINFEHFINELSIEAVYIPSKDEATFPVDPLQLFKLTPSLDVKTGLERGVLGGKLNYYGVLDLSISYIWDLDDFYTFKENRLYYDRVHNLGLSIKGLIGPFGLWVEGNYRGKDIEFITGFDTTIGEEDQGLLNVQFYGNYIFDYQNDTVEDIINNKLRSISSSLTLGCSGRVEYSLFNSELTPVVTLLYLNRVDDSSLLLVKPEIIYSPLDSLDITIGATITDEDEKSFIYTTFKYSF